VLQKMELLVAVKCDNLMRSLALKVPCRWLPGAGQCVGEGSLAGSSARASPSPPGTNHPWGWDLGQDGPGSQGQSCSCIPAPAPAV